MICLITCSNPLLCPWIVFQSFLHTGLIYDKSILMYFTFSWLFNWGLSLHCIFHVFTLWMLLMATNYFHNHQFFYYLQSLAADSFRFPRCTIVKSVNSDSSRLLYLSSPFAQWCWLVLPIGPWMTALTGGTGL